jgi:hypothetical protein
MASQGWDKATVKAQIIDVYNSTDVSNYSALDTTSIMMYVLSSFLLSCLRSSMLSLT